MQSFLNFLNPPPIQTSASPPIQTSASPPIQTSAFGSKDLSGCNTDDDAQLLKALKFENEQPEKARSIYLSLVNKGNTDAQFRLGMLTLNNNPAQAFDYIEKAALQGHPQAINQKGLMYMRGKGVEQNYEMAFTCFNQVAEQIPQAKSRLGFLYYHGYGVVLNDAKAFECFNAIADSDLDAAFFLGALFATGRVSNQVDYLKAGKYFLIAAQLGNKRALCTLGSMYIKGLGFEKDILKGVMYFKEAVNAEVEGALPQLIISYDNNPVMMSEDPEHVSYLQLAAERGNARAQCKLGQRYSEYPVGTHLHSLGTTYLEEAARQNDVQAIQILIEKYPPGCGVKLDIKLSTYIHLCGADEGNKKVMPGLYALGVIYQQQKNYSQAFACFYNAAKLGDATSLYDLQKMKEDKNLIPHHQELFLTYLKEACTLKNPHTLLLVNCPEKALPNQFVMQRFLSAHQFLGEFYSQKNSGLFGSKEDYFNAIFHYKVILENDFSVIPKLARLYKEGRSNFLSGVQPNGLKAIKYYKLAVAEGVMDKAEAYKNIAEIYQNGMGVPVDKKLAEAYEKRAEAANRDKNGLVKPPDRLLQRQLSEDGL